MQGLGVFDGYEIPNSALPFSLANITHNYGSDDACLTFKHNNKSVLVILLHPNRQVRMFLKSGPRASTAKAFKNAFPLDIVTVPTLAPLEADEQYVTDETVRKNAATRLASRSLRNIWLRASETEFNSFAADVEEAWPNTRIKKPEQEMGNPPLVRMYFSEKRIDREVQWAGFGFQIWMQFCTHFSRGNKNSILIIDEPDIYLHPDLQKKLLQIIRDRFAQFIIATHLVELINEAEGSEILSINSDYRSAKSVKSEQEFQDVFRYIGSGSNADFARVARAKRVVFVEGKDGKLIRRLAARFGYINLADLQRVPIVPVGGYTQWHKAVHSAWAFKEILNIEIAVFCLFDRDYRCDAEIRKFEDDVRKQVTNCHVWGFKEIENYLLNEVAFKAVISSELGAGKADRSIALDWDRLVREATEPFRHDVFANILSNDLRFHRIDSKSIDQGTVISRVNKLFEENWNTTAGRIALAPGKDVLAQMISNVKSEFKVSVTTSMIVRHLRRESMPNKFIESSMNLNNFAQCDRIGHKTLLCGRRLAPG